MPRFVCSFAARISHSGAVRLSPGPDGSSSLHQPFLGIPRHAYRRYRAVVELQKSIPSFLGDGAALRGHANDHREEVLCLLPSAG